MDQNHEMLNYLEYEKPMQLSEDEQRVRELRRQIASLLFERLLLSNGDNTHQCSEYENHASEYK